MTIVRNEIYQVGLKVETTEGTKIALTAADFITAHNAKFTPDIKMAGMKSATGTMSKSVSRPGLRSGKISFDAYLRGGASAGVAPELGVAFKACGLKEARVDTISVTYTPAPQATIPPSVTVEIRRDGKCSRIWGARGTMTLKAQVGEAMLCSFAFTGCDWEEIDLIQMAGVTYTAIPEIMLQAATLTLDASSTNLNLSSVDIDLGNTVTLRQSVNASSGYTSALITDRTPALSFDPEAVLASEIDFFGKWKSGATVAFSSGALGSGAGKVCTITSPKLQYQGVSQAESNGLATLAINGLLCKNAGDDELSIAFT